MTRAVLLGTCVALGACARSAPVPAPAAAPVPAGAPAAAAAPEPPPVEAKPLTTIPAGAASESPDASDQVAGPLVQESPERDPKSETVTIKIITESRRPAHVVWGRKDLGVTPLEITRPRGSGPLDLVVVAPGCLPLHTRAFTDRDDTIALRLYGESEGPSLLGYHAEAQSKDVKGRQGRR